MSQKSIIEIKQSSSPSQSAELVIPIRTYVRGFFAAATIVFAWKLGSLFLILFLALLIGMTLFSAEQFLQRHHWKRWMSLSVLIFGTLGAVSSIVFVLIPKAVGQLSDVIAKTGNLREKVVHLFPPGMGRNTAEKLFDHPPEAMANLGEKAAAMGAQMMGGFYDTALILIIAIYMLVDGPRAYRWFIAYFDREERTKLDATINEVRPIVSAYILGQGITSLLAGVFTYIVARLLHVPGALTLAILAALLDILPIIGFIATAVCAGALAFTVSAQAALTMVIAFLVYHVIETYFLIPFIYGNRLKLSTLAVLLSLVVADALAGIPGMIAVLPLVAAYPAIEKLWLRKFFSASTVPLHQDQLAEAEKQPDGLSNPEGNLAGGAPCP